MAELVIKIGSVSPDPKHYQDGDILAAFNSRFIRCVHAQHICHVKQAGGGIGALRDNAHVARDWFEHTHQYRFERVSRTEIKRILLADLTEVIFDGMPKLVDGKMQHMDVELYVNRRMLHNGHKMFGTTGAEVWYGGRTDVSDAKLTLVWNAIETKTPHLEANFPLWPAGSKDLISHLFVTVDDFNEAEASDLVSSELDFTDPEDIRIVKKRRRHIVWRDVIETKEYAAIEDKTVSVDLRETITPLVREDIVQTREASRLLLRKTQALAFRSMRKTRQIASASLRKISELVGWA